MTFEKKLIVRSFIPDIVAALLTFGYSITSAQISITEHSSVFIVLFTLIIVTQFVFAPVTDHIAYADISKRVSKFEHEETTETERTELLESIHHVPFTTAAMTYLYFLLGSAVIFCTYYFKFNVSLNICILLVMNLTFGSFVAAMFADSYSRKICNTYAVKIVQKGVNSEYVKEKLYFGNSILSEMIMFIILPILFTAIISCAVLIAGYVPGNHEGAEIQIRRMLWTSALNIAIEIVLILFFYRTMFIKNKKMSLVLRNMLQSNLKSDVLLDSDLANEVSLSHHLINCMILLFRKTLKSSQEIAAEINESSSKLLKTSNETETTSVEQSTGTKEIVSTMEDISRLSNDIESNIVQVAEMAEETVNAVMKGSGILEINLQKMSLIEKSSKETILGIQNLNEKINSIGDITNIINSIADQTKIIAFNAELEATNVQNGSRNFKNVSGEIRRLANSTMESTKEIKERISEIQLSSESLIKSSQNATTLINRGSILADELKNKFSSIKLSAETNSSTASEIKYLITQQNSAFEQIVKTLQQINTSIQNFSESTRTIIDTTDTLNKSVNTLEHITSGGDE